MQTTRHPGPALRFARRVLALTSVALVVAAARADQTVEIVHRFKSPDPRYLEIRYAVEKSTLTSLFPQAFTNQEDRTWTLTQRLKPGSAPPGVEITWKLDRVQAHRRENKNELRFDSLRPTQPLPQLTLLKQWSSRSFDIRLNRLGKLFGLTGYQTLPSAPSASTVNRGRVGVFDPPNRDEFVSVLATVFEEYVPPNPVNPGQTWKRAYEAVRAPYGTFRGDVEYRLAGVARQGERRIATIGFRGTLELTPNNRSRDGDSRKYVVHRAEHRGEVQFDVGAGELVSLLAVDDLKVDVVMTTTPKPTSGPASQPAAAPTSYTFTFEEKHTTKVSVSHTAPVMPVVVQTSQPAPRAPAPVQPPASTERRQYGRMPPASRNAPQTGPTTQPHPLPSRAED